MFVLWLWLWRAGRGSGRTTLQLPGRILYHGLTRVLRHRFLQGDDHRELGRPRVGSWYAAMAGLKTNLAVQTWAVSEFLADVIGYTVQAVSSSVPSPDAQRSPGSCSK